MNPIPFFAMYVLLQIVDFYKINNNSLTGLHDNDYHLKQFLHTTE